MLKKLRKVWIWLALAVHIGQCAEFHVNNDVVNKDKLIFAHTVSILLAILIDYLSNFYFASIIEHFFTMQSM